MHNKLGESFLILLAVAGPVNAGVIEYGDEDVLGTGIYGTDPKAGATLQGLAPGVITLSASSFGHGFPFTPSVGEFPGTDQIYVGSVQTGFHDGYSVSSPRVNGPQVLSLDYSSLVPAGEHVVTLALGIAADDFQFPAFGQLFSANVHGSADAALTGQLNALNQGGPQVQFFTIGISPAILAANNILTLTIDNGGDGGDGWAVDYLTVGVTSAPDGAQPVPEPASLLLFGLGGLGVWGCSRRARKTGICAA